MAKKNPKTQKSVTAKTGNQKSSSIHATNQPLYFIFIITFIVFIPSLSAQFVIWDDPEFIYNNPIVVNASIDNLFQTIKEIFSTTSLGAYSPLVIVSFVIEKIIFGLEHPFFWHLDNVLLHLVCVYFVFRICKLLQFSPLVSFLVALLFGIHPMHVESVAWVTERKDVLFSAFYLGALLMYIKSKKEEKRKYVLLVYILFLLSLFSKIQAVSFPLSILVIDYIIDGKISRKTLRDVLPFFLLSIGIGFIGIYILAHQAVLVTNVLSFPNRIILGLYSIVIYGIKSLIPYQLVALYPYPTSIPAYMYASVIIITVVLALVYGAWKQHNKNIVAATCFFFFNILFVLQVLTAGQGYLADRYAYIPYLGLFIVYGVFYEKLESRFPAQKNNLRLLLTIYLVALAYIAFQQNKVWQDTETLWTHVLKYYPDQSTPYINRAIYYYKTQAYDKSLSDYTKAIALEPNNADLYQGRAKVYFEISGNDKALLLQALEDCNKAILLKNNVAEYYNNRANVYGKLNDLETALLNVNKSISLDPNYADAYITRYRIYHMQNKMEDAMKDEEKYLSLKPDDDAIRANLENQKRSLHK